MNTWEVQFPWSLALLRFFQLSLSCHWNCFVLIFQLTHWHWTFPIKPTKIFDLWIPVNFAVHVCYVLENSGNLSLSWPESRTGDIQTDQVFYILEKNAKFLLTRNFSESVSCSCCLLYNFHLPIYSNGMVLLWVIIQCISPYQWLWTSSVVFYYEKVKSRVFNI